MRREDFSAAMPGALVQTPGGALAFKPHDLPPKALELDGEIWRAEISAATELARLDTILPAAELDPFLATFALLEREAFCTSRMEGTYTTPQDLALFELGGAARAEAADKDDQTREVANYRVACRRACEELKANRRITHTLIRGAHKLLLAGTRGESRHPGDYRKTQNFIGRGIDAATARFVPPPPTDLPGCLESFESFLALSQREDADVPLMTAVALAHYQFETIHPFEDGNGRIGRLLIPLMLIASGKLREPVLHASYTLEKHREEYTRLLLRVSQHGDWKSWILFFVKMLAAAARDCGELVQKLRALRQEYRSRVAAPKRSVALQKLIDSLFRSPATTVQQARKATEVGFAQTDQHLQTLVGFGIVKEVTGKARNRRFVATGILDVIFGGG